MKMFLTCHGFRSRYQTAIFLLASLGSISPIPDPEDKSSGPCAQNSNNNQDHSMTLLELTGHVFHSLKSSDSIQVSFSTSLTHAHQVSPPSAFIHKSPFKIFIKISPFNKYLSQISFQDILINIFF